MKPTTKITWDKQYEQVGETKADDVQDLLSEFLPGMVVEGIILEEAYV